jgi:hypothetical protein
LIFNASQKLFEGPELEILTLNQQMAPQYIPISGKEKDEKCFAGKGY